MGIIGKIIGIASSFLPFKKGGKVQRKKMANGGLVLDDSDKAALASLKSRVGLRKGGRVKRKK